MGAQTALIFGSADCSGWSFLASLRTCAPLVICADGGLRCALAAGFSPDCYIGDGDSGGVPVRGAENCVLMPEKDQTDLQAAYRLARAHGCDNVIFTGCTGGRQDHHIANLQLLETAHREGCKAEILDAENSVTCISAGEHVLQRGTYHYFSLLPIDPVLQGLTIEGAKYPLVQALVRRGDSLTVSNEWCADAVRIHLEAGLAWLVCSTKK